MKGRSMTKANRVHSMPRSTTSKRKPPPTNKSTSLPAGPAVDPIWALIEKHRKERAAYTIIADRPGDIPAGAIDEVLAAGHSVLSTRPTTLAGAIAVLRYVGSQQSDDDPHEGSTQPTCRRRSTARFGPMILREHHGALGSALGQIVAVTGGTAPASDATAVLIEKERGGNRSCRARKRTSGNQCL
jgi:hypothetical protein